MTVPGDRGIWRKSTYSQQESACVEISMADTVGVRDTKDRRGGKLTVPASVWSAFTAVVTTDRD